MRKADAITRLKMYEAELKTLGVKRHFLSGSTARDEARTDSGVDLFFDFEKGTLDLVDLMDIKDRVSAIPDQQTGVMTRGSIHPRLRASMEQSAVPMFWCQGIWRSA